MIDGENCLVLKSIEHVCRICLIRSRNMKSLFTSESRFEKKLYEVIMICAPIKITVDDEMPEHMCMNCMEQLSQAYSFRKLCEASDVILRHQKVAKANYDTLHESRKINDVDMIKDEQEDPVLGINVAHKLFDYDTLSENSELNISNKIKKEHGNDILDTKIYQAVLLNESLHEVKETDALNTIKEEHDKGPDQLGVTELHIFDSDEFENKIYVPHTADVLTNERLDTLEKPYQQLLCEECGDQFCNKISLVTHINRCHSVKDTQVEYCKTRGKNIIPRMIQKEEESYLCNYCGEVFPQMSYFEHHLFTHTGEISHSCETCHRSFAELDSLKSHLVTHAGEKTHVCKIGDKNCPNSNYLASRIQTHNGEKLIECQVMSPSHEESLLNSGISKDCPNMLQDEYEEMTSCDSISSIEIFTEDNQNSTKKRKTHRCIYCRRDVSNFMRHLERRHSTEPEVIEICSNEAKSAERKGLIASLRKKGNYLKNRNDCFNPEKESSTPNRTYLPCDYCLGFYSTKTLSRHRKKCSGDKALGRAQTEGQSKLVEDDRIDERLRKEVFPHMRADRVSLEAKRDVLICSFGAKYYKMHRKKHSINVTSLRMRELSKILLEVKNFEPSINDLFQALQPQFFHHFGKATKIVGKAKSHNDGLTIFAVGIASSLKQCCKIAINLALRTKQLVSPLKPSEVEANLKTMINLFESNWKFETACIQNKSKFISPGIKKRILIPWTAQQKKVLKDFFKSHITSKKPPKKSECEILKEQYPDLLKNKTWLKMKVFIQNQYTKSKIHSEDQ